jgi:hypothetical protein
MSADWSTPTRVTSVGTAAAGRRRSATNGDSVGILDFVTRVVDTEDDMRGGQEARATSHERTSATSRHRSRATAASMATGQA